MTDAQQIVDQIRALPPLPDTALKLVEVVNDPRSTVDDIVEIIRYDQAVTGEVLRLCNSVHFGLARKVTSLNDALVCLGTVKVLQMVMSIHTNGTLAQEQRGYGLEPGVLWKHSVAVALASSAMAQRLKLPFASQVFTAGLLHDIGKVILNEYVAADFSEIVRRVTEDRVSFVEAEQQVLGFSHQDVGGMIAEKWALPEGIVRCIRHHHDPSAVEPPDPWVDTVYLADCICLLLGIGLGEDGLYYRADAAVMKRYDLHEQDLESVGAQTLTELSGIEELFSSAGKANRSPSADRPVGAK